MTIHASSEFATSHPSGEAPQLTAEHFYNDSRRLTELTDDELVAVVANRRTAVPSEDDQMLASLDRGHLFEDAALDQGLESSVPLSELLQAIQQEVPDRDRQRDLLARARYYRDNSSPERGSERVAMVDLVNAYEEARLRNLPVIDATDQPQSPPAAEVLPGDNPEDWDDFEAWDDIDEDSAIYEGLERFEDVDDDEPESQELLAMLQKPETTPLSELEQQLHSATEALAATLCKRMNSPLLRRGRRKYERQSAEYQQLLLRQVQAKVQDRRNAVDDQTALGDLDMVERDELLHNPQEFVALQIIQQGDVLAQQVHKNMTESKFAALGMFLNKGSKKSQFVKGVLIGAGAGLTGAAIASGVGAAVAGTVLVAASRFGRASAKRDAREGYGIESVADSSTAQTIIENQAASSPRGAIEYSLRHIERQIAPQQERRFRALARGALAASMIPGVMAAMEFAPAVKDFAEGILGQLREAPKPWTNGWGKAPGLPDYGSPTELGDVPGYDFAWESDHPVSSGAHDETLSPGGAAEADDSSAVDTSGGEMDDTSADDEAATSSSASSTSGPAVSQPPVGGGEASVPADQAEAPAPVEVVPPVFEVHSSADLLAFTGQGSTELLNGLPNDLEISAYTDSGDGTLEGVARGLLVANGTPNGDVQAVVQALADENRSALGPDQWLQRGDVISLRDAKAVIAAAG